MPGALPRTAVALACAVSAACATARLVPAADLAGARCDATGRPGRAEVRCSVAPGAAVSRLRIVEATGGRIVIAVERSDRARAAGVPGIDRAVGVGDLDAGSWLIVLRAEGAEAEAGSVQVPAPEHGARMDDAMDDAYGRMR